MPDVLPPDDACYIVSKHIYLKKRSGLIDSMVKVETIDMGEVLPEYANMKLPKIKDKIFGKVLGFFKLTYKTYKSEAGTILNLKTHPKNEKLKKIDFTVPHQRVSGGGCKYDIVVSPKYINCGTIHSHSNFGAFHSGTDVNDERYFDGLHITVGHVDRDVFSISACVVVNGKRIQVDPCDYIDGLEKVKEEKSAWRKDTSSTKFYTMENPDLIVEDKSLLKMVTPRFTQPVITSTQGKQFQTQFDWSGWDRTSTYKQGEKDLSPCESCVYKEIKLEDALDDIVFDDDDLSIFGENDKLLFERNYSALYDDGETDEDDIIRKNNHVSRYAFEEARKKALKKSIKCECQSTFFVENPEVTNICPSCDKEHPGKSFTMEDFLKQKKETCGEKNEW